MANVPREHFQCSQCLMEDKLKTLAKNGLVFLSELNLEPCQISMMEGSKKIINALKA